MEGIKQCIIKSLDGEDDNLFHYLPYLLQDLWEIGSSPQIIIQLLIKHYCLNDQSKVLDLGCGKGAVSVNIAREFECQVLGIDALTEFIEEANFWADKYHQSHLCTFEVGDIRDSISNLNNFDLIVLGSIGPVFGNIENTLNSVKQCLIPNGYVILDDGYIPENSSFKNENYLSKNKAEKQIKNSGFKIIESFKIDDSIIVESDKKIYNKIEIRVKELREKYPQTKNLFEAYLENQRIENDILENKVECVTWLLQK